MQKLVTLLLAAILMAPPAATQNAPAYPTTTAFVAHGRDIEMLEDAFRQLGVEAVGSADDIRLSLSRLPGGRGSVHVYRFRYTGPSDLNPTVEHYHAAIVAGRLQPLERVGHDEALTGPNGSASTLVQGQTTSLDATGPILFDLELAHASEPDGYGAPPLSDAIVSYTEVRSGTRQAPMTYARIVFLDPSERGRDFTVDTRNGVIAHVFEGIPASDDWVNSARFASPP